MNNTIPFEQFNYFANKLLNLLECSEYSSSTLAGYKCALKKLHSFMKKNEIQEYNNDTGGIFLESCLTESGYSDRWKRYIKTSVQRFDDYVQGRPYTIMHTSKLSQTPNVFSPVLKKYTDYMQERGFRPSTIETRKIYASQLLVHLEKQSLLDLEILDAKHIGAAFLASSSKQGFCEKVPAFLKYLLKSGTIDKDLSAFLPRYSIDQKIPSVYSKNELTHLISGIDRSTPVGKRDYAILSLAVTYGMRALDISSLKLSAIDYGKKKLTFVQSKTSALYSVVLQQGVYYALESYINCGRPDSDSPYVFLRSYAPFTRIGRKAIWSITSKHLRKSSIDISGRNQGTHAIRSSLASYLVNRDVPYSVVQKILGHENPNSTQYYASIDIENLRKCSLESPAPTGNFASYLAGGEWK